METFVEFHNSRRKWLRGMMHFPEHARSRGKASRRLPGVVLFHGFTGDRMESHWMFVKCSRALAAAGIASLRFDFYGSGESEGDFREVTLSGEIADARVAVGFFRRQTGIDPRRVGLLGLSLGGLIAATLAPRLKSRALVLWSALAHAGHLRTLAEASLKPIPGVSGRFEYEAREVSPHFLDDAITIEPLQCVRRFKGPTLIIHPQRDAHVPYSHAEDYYRAADSSTKELVTISGADHVFTSVAWEREVIARSVEWFRIHLCEG